MKHHDPQGGLFGGGYEAALVDTIEYVTIATEENAADYANLTVARQQSSGTSGKHRGLFVGGWVAAASNVIDYVTIASVTNATDFGDLTAARTGIATVGSYHGGLYVS